MYTRTSRLLAPYVIPKNGQAATWMNGYSRRHFSGDPPSSHDGVLQCMSIDAFKVNTSTNSSSSNNRSNSSSISSPKCF